MIEIPATTPGPETIELPNPGPFVPQKHPPGTDLPPPAEAPGLPSPIAPTPSPGSM
jgi:hypothetical protein